MPHHDLRSKDFNRLTHSQSPACLHSSIWSSVFLNFRLSLGLWRKLSIHQGFLSLRLLTANDYLIHDNRLNRSAKLGERLIYCFSNSLLAEQGKNFQCLLYYLNNKYCTQC